MKHSLLTLVALATMTTATMAEYDVEIEIELAAPTQVASFSTESFDYIVDGVWESADEVDDCTRDASEAEYELIVECLETYGGINTIAKIKK